MNSWINGLVGSTALKYTIAMIATFAAAKTGIAEGEITAWLTQFIGLVAMAWGMWEASRSKVIMQGQRVSTSELPIATQIELKGAIEVIKDKKLKPIFSK